ncbi:MAG: glycosyltransferase [Leptospiraceae bacterium]|nr:glycosyltransferase [Leptospiraceae bacterium]
MKAKKPLKVLHLGRFYPATGGLETHVVQLLTGLSRVSSRAIEADNLVAGSIGPGEHEAAEGFRVFSVRRFGIVASTAVAPGFPIALMKLARNYDIIHIHLPDPLSVMSALLLPAGKPIVLTWHSDIVRQKFLLRFFRPFIDRLIRRASVVAAATPAHFSSSSQLDACPESKRYVLTLGANPRDFRITPDVRAAMKEWQKRIGKSFLVFALGRHVYYKGFEYLVEATAALPPKTMVVIGGEGPLTGTYRDIAIAKGVEQRVILPGRLSEMDRLALLHLCDVFCLPSVEPSEAFGLVQRDAMFCGKPVVCCDLRNGVNYVNQDKRSGLVVPPRDSGALSRAISRLLSDSALRKRLGSWGKERAEREFTEATMVRQATAIYRHALPRNSIHSK